MSSVAQYHDTYTPYAPVRPSGNGLFDMLRMALMVQGSTTQMYPGASFNPGVSNVRDLATARNEDQLAQEAMRIAVEAQKKQIASILSTPQSMFQAPGGQPFTQQQRQDYTNLVENFGPTAYGFLMQTDLGRRAIDQLAGGYGAANFTASLAFNSKRMVDPISGSRGLGSESVEMIDAYRRNYLVGNDSAMNNLRMSGFAGADVVPLQGNLSRDGRSNDTLYEQRLLTDQTFVNAVQSGTLSREDLDRMGVGDVETMLNEGLDSPRGINAMYESIGQRQGKILEDSFKAMGAIKELIGPDSRLLEESGQLLQHLDNFTRDYRQQMSDKDVATIIRQTNSSLSELNYTYEDIARRQGYALQVGNARNLEAALSTQIAANSASNLRGLNTIGAFEARAFGMMDADQMDRKSIQDDTAYANSESARMAAAVLVRAEDIGGQFKDTAEGRRMQDAIQALRETGQTGDAELDRMMVSDPLQFAQRAAAAMEGDNNFQRITNLSRNDHVTERAIYESNLANSSARATAQREQFIEQGGRVAAARGLNDLADRMGSDELVDLSEGAVRYAIDMNPKALADRESRNKLMAQYLHDRLANGSEAQRKALKSLGGTREEQMQALATQAAQVFNSLEGATGTTIVNTANQVGQRAINASEATQAADEARALISELTVGTVTEGPQEAIRGMIEYAEEIRDDPTKFDSEEFINRVLRGNKDPEQRKKLELAFEKLEDAYDDLNADLPANASEKQIADRRKLRQDAIAKEMQVLIDKLSGDGSDEEGVVEDGKGGPKGLHEKGRVNNLQVDQLVLNFPDGTNISVDQVEAKTMSESTGNT